MSEMMKRTAIFDQAERDDLERFIGSAKHKVNIGVPFMFGTLEGVQWLVGLHGDSVVSLVSDNAPVWVMTPSDAISLANALLDAAMEIRSRNQSGQ